MRLHFVAASAVCALGWAALAIPGQMAAQRGSDTVLAAANAQKLLPATVRYHGQAVPIQMRNTGGVQFADGHRVLAGLTDRSGWSSAEGASMFQAYLKTDVPLKMDGKVLPRGEYAIAFSANMLEIEDLNGRSVMMPKAGMDTEIKRPMPLEVTPNPGGGYRLYCGRQFVVFTR